MNLNRNQIIAITIAILGVLMASTAQLTDLFGPGVTKAIISVASLGNSILSSILAIVTGQTGMVKDVAAMQGVESIKVNAQANSTLAAIAVDPAQAKVSATSGDLQTVAQTAKDG